MGETWLSSGRFIREWVDHGSSGGAEDDFYYQERLLGPRPSFTTIRTEMPSPSVLSQCQNFKKRPQDNHSE